MPSQFHLGIKSVDTEIQVDELPVVGRVPSWLSGSLIFNGPGKFEVGDQKFGHWFDGLAMLRRFTFANGNISFANRFLCSRGYEAAMDTGQIGFEQFGTDTNPTFIQRLSLLISSKQFPNNANINTLKHGDRYLALTETPTTIEFQPMTLTTLGDFGFEGHIPATVTTAHPHHDYEKKTTFNITQKFSLQSRYNIYSLQHNSSQRELIATIRVNRPAYMHSFGMTERFIILTEIPLVVNPIRFLMDRHPFIENYQWRPEQGTRFLLFRKNDGELVGRYETEAFFTFHHINAYEQSDNIIIDICAYPDPTIVDELYLDHMRQPDREHIPALQVRRYRLSIHGNRTTHEVILDDAFELPGINSLHKNAKQYQFAYGLGLHKTDPSDFVNQMVKLDMNSGEVDLWHEDGCYPGELVFVPAPNAKSEDDGLILSVVLDSNEGRSFLLILDANSFDQMARATIPHAIPFGFHGQFYEDVQ